MESLNKFKLSPLIAGIVFGSAVYQNATAQPTIKVKRVFYSIQLKSFSNLKDAVKFINTLPESLKKSSYIYKINNNIYRVQIYLLTSKRSAEQILKKISSFGIKGKIVSIPDYFLYSVQIATVKTRKQAEKILNSLPARLKKDAFIYLTDSGYYTVRIYKETNKLAAVKKLNEIKKIFRHSEVVPTSPLKLKIRQSLQKLKKQKTTPKKEVSQKAIQQQNNIPLGTPKAVVIITPNIPEKSEKINKIKLKSISNKELQAEFLLEKKKAKKEDKIIKKKLKIILEQSQKLAKKEEEKKKIEQAKAKNKKVTMERPKKEPIESNITSLVSLFPSLDRAINISGSWSYNFQESDEYTSSFLQSYNINTPGEITDAIKYNLSYLFTKTSSSDGSWQKTSTPSAGLRLTNDIFSSSLTGMWKKSDSSGGDEVSSSNYNLTFSSNWSSKYPYLSAAASKSQTESSSTKTKNISQRISTGYTYNNNYSINYSFTHSKTQDNERETFNENYNHNINISGKKAFFNGKILIAASESINFFQNKYSVKSINGTTYVPIDNFVALSGIDTTPDLGTLSINGLLTDKDYSTPANINLQDIYTNIAIESDYRKVDLISIYLTGNFTDADINSLKWNLYTSDDGNVWNLQQIDIPFSYDSQTKTLNFQTPEIYTKYIKLVLSFSNALNPTYVTEVEAYEKIPNTSESIVESSKTSDNTRISARIELPYNIYYSISFERTTSDWKELSKKITNNISKSWRYKFYLINVGFSRTDYFITDLPTKSSQSVTFNIKASPIATLSLRGGTSYITSYTDFKKTSTTFVISGGANAKVFTGLNAKLNTDIIYSKNEETSKSSTSINNRLSINARLYPSLNVSTSLQHNISEETTTDIISISSTWTPSDIIRISLSQGLIVKSDGESRSTTGLSTSIVPKGGDIKYNFGVSLYNGNTSYKGSIYWQISDQLSASGYLKYEASSKTLSGGANMNARW